MLLALCLVGHLLLVTTLLLGLNLGLVEGSPRVPDDGGHPHESGKDATGHRTSRSGKPTGDDGVGTEDLTGKVGEGPRGKAR
jgi:hypothetical protein